MVKDKFKQSAGKSGARKSQQKEHPKGKSVGGKRVSNTRIRRISGHR